MRKALLVTLCFVAAAALRAAPSILQQRDLGPHAVGFRVIERYDTSRPFRFPADLEGRPRKGNTARPIQIGVWYPAEKSPARPMRLADYVALIATEQDFTIPVERRQERGERTLLGFQLVRDASPEQRRRLLDLETAAVRDAPAAPGRFPLILWSLGSPAIYQGNAEYLASHGYVVAIAPRIPPSRGLSDTIAVRTDYESKARDMAFLIDTMAEFPPADTQRIGTVGFSAGGRWALAEGMRNPNVRAVASLDTIMLFDDDGGQFLSMPFVHPDRMRVPVVHLVRREWVPRETSKLWEQMRYADRTGFVFEDPRLDHLDFVSIGYATVLAGARPQAAAAVAHTFRFVNELLRAFFGAHLSGSREAAVRLATVERTTGLPANFVTASRLPGSPAAFTDEQVQDALIDDVPGTLRAIRRVWKETGKPPVAEGTLNLAGYGLLATDRVPEGVEVLAFNAELFPESANVYDSLSDAYIRAGDERRALELAEKCLALLPKDPSTPERKDLIRRSAEEKRARLKKN